jgi:four helix bundle protein
MHGYRDLLVRQKSMDLVTRVYRITRAFPKSEIYGLASQMQRAAISIPSNIAEGHGLKQSLGYARHLAIASGSLAELETQLEIASRLGYLKTDEIAGSRRGGSNVGRFAPGFGQGGIRPRAIARSIKSRVLAQYGEGRCS